jgi:hypothetical protein
VKHNRLYLCVRKKVGMREGLSMIWNG